jgi:hypothetical protein
LLLSINSKLIWENGKSDMVAKYHSP